MGDFIQLSHKICQIFPVTWVPRETEGLSGSDAGVEGGEMDELLLRAVEVDIRSSKLRFCKSRRSWVIFIVQTWGVVSCMTVQTGLMVLVQVSYNSSRMKQYQTTVLYKYDHTNNSL